MRLGCWRGRIPLIVQELFGYLWSEEYSNSLREEDVLMGREAKRDAIMTEERMVTGTIQGTASTRRERMELMVKRYSLTTSSYK
jgi:hypothetical protein